MDPTPAPSNIISMTEIKIAEPGEGPLPQGELMGVPGAVYPAGIQNQLKSPIRCSASKVFFLMIIPSDGKTLANGPLRHCCAEWLLVYTCQSIVHRHISMQDAIIFSALNPPFLSLNLSPSSSAILLNGPPPPSPCFLRTFHDHVLLSDPSNLMCPFVGIWT